MARARAAGLAGLVLAAGCAGSPEPAPSQPGAHQTLGPLALTGVRVAAPAGVAYEAGADVLVALTVRNSGAAPDTLVGVSTPAATTVEIRWDRDCDGTAEVLPVLPIPARSDVGRSGPYAPGGPAYFLRLVDLDRRLAAGSSVPVAFTFAGAGVAVLEVPVDGRPPGVRGSCAPGS